MSEQDYRELANNLKDRYGINEILCELSDEEVEALADAVAGLEQC